MAGGVSAMVKTFTGVLVDSGDSKRMSSNAVSIIGAEKVEKEVDSMARNSSGMAEGKTVTAPMKGSSPASTSLTIKLTSRESEEDGLGSAMIVRNATHVKQHSEITTWMYILTEKISIQLTRI
jgi:hypothetical protein